MAISTCVKCGNTSFEAVNNNPINSTNSILFIQCSKCGGVIGTLSTNIPNVDSINILNNKLTTIISKLT